MGPYSLVADVVMLPARRADPLAKLVIEAFISDIPFSSAILQPEVRLDDEFAQVVPPVRLRPPVTSSTHPMAL